MKACSVAECDRPSRSRGLCNAHYLKLHRSGDMEPLPALTAEDRFWANVSKTDGCWNWTAYRNPKGYGQFGIRGHGTTPAHRFAYELQHGPIPEGLVIDHLCRNTSCVNPDHLEAVTSRENTLRGDSPVAMRARATTCSKGHPLEGENLRIRDDGARRCVTCVRAWGQASYRRRREAERRAS